LLTTLSGLGEAAEDTVADSSADYVLSNGRIYTVDPRQPWADTKVLVTVLDGQIIHDLVYQLGDSDLVDPEAMGAGQLEDVHCIDLLHGRQTPTTLRDIEKPSN
jgi:hypothetical protein